MANLEQRYHGESAPSLAPHPGGPRSAAQSTPGHLDLEALAQVDDAALLGPVALQWTQSLLEVARFELARADDKANTMFRFYGVVAALSIGLLAGRGWSPMDLLAAAQIVFWFGCSSMLASGVLLGTVLYPRSIRNQPAHELLYFGHVVAYRDVAELAAGLNAVEAHYDERLIAQLLSVSRLVHKKYRLMRWALVTLGVGVAACIVGVLFDGVLT